MLVALHDGRRFLIEHDEKAGWYLYVFSGDRCTHDHLQDTLDQEKAQALEEFGVPRSAWRSQEP
jgi:hypothetical protein